MTPPEIARLDGLHASVILELSPRGILWRHLGLAVQSPPLGPLRRWRAPATFSPDEDLPLPLLPTGGLGWFGPSGLGLRRADGTGLIVQFSECTLARKSDCLRARMADPDSGAACAIEFRLSEKGALRISTVLENTGPEPLHLDRLASAVLPLPSAMREIRSLRGVHAAESAECREPMPEHTWVRETRRGIAGHGGPPGFYAMADGATRDAGLVFALQLAWSGDSRLTIERSDEGGWIASAEAVLSPGEVVLAPGQRNKAPSVLLSISENGANGAMAQQHAAVREILRWPGGAMAPRPVHLNTWEAFYFAHDEARIGALAEAAAALGIERFVLDDGWFLGRRDDRRALGDWIPDPAIYPNGLGPLARKVQGLGMQFGLWVEPEMVSPNSDLYRAHPDWALAIPGRDRPTARHQLVLDMRREDVRDHLFDALDRLLCEAPIGYLKWDHNRDLAPPGGASQVAGTYALLARLRAAHPEVEIESCAGGGGRCDAGITAYTHRFWTSDNLDAVSRVAIQRGFNAFLPPETMGAHVGASPAHATGRRQSLAFRAAVACMGHFGVELDPGKLGDSERAELADWIGFYKQWRDLIHASQVRLGEGEDGLLWQAHGDERQWLLFLIRTSPPANRRAEPLSLPFLSDGDWRVRLLRLSDPSRWLGRHPWTPELSDGVEIDGAWLRQAGLPLTPMAAESVAIFHLERTK
jgi:alpha-galactosidase